MDRRLEELISGHGQLAVTEPVVMEVVAGCRTDGRETDLRRLLARFPLLRFDAVADFDAAARIYRQCRRAGVTPRGMVDCLLASVAQASGHAPGRRPRSEPSRPRRRYRPRRRIGRALNLATGPPSLPCARIGRPRQPLRPGHRVLHRQRAGHGPPLTHPGIGRGETRQRPAGSITGQRPSHAGRGQDPDPAQPARGGRSASPVERNFPLPDRARSGGAPRCSRAATMVPSEPDR